MVVVRSVSTCNSTALGKLLRSFGKSALIRLTTWIVFAPGWRWTFKITAGVEFIHAASLVFSTSSTHGGHVAEHHRRAVAPRHHHALVVGRGGDLIVGVDLVRLILPVEAALREIEAGRLQRGPDVLQIDPVRRERGRIRLDAHGRFLTADGDHADPRDLRDLLRQARVREILDLRERHAGRRQRERPSTGASAGFVLL